MRKEKLFFVSSLLCLFFLWSSSYTALALALESFSPGGLALFRFMVASFVLILLSFRYKVHLPEKKDLPLILISGVFGLSFYHIILVYGQKTTSVALSSILLNTYPIFVAVFSFFMFKEFINSLKWIGMIICFIGMIVVSGGGDLNLAFRGSSLLFLLGAAIISLYDIEQKQLMKKYSPFELTCYFIWGGTILLMVFSGSLLRDLEIVRFNSIIPAVYLGAFSTVFAPLLWAKLILKYSVSSLACCCYVTPFFAMVLAFLFLHQVPEKSAILGSIIVILGLLIINGSKSFNLKLNSIKSLKSILIKNI